MIDVSGLLPRAFESFPLGAIRPRGWLLNQLKIQANGLTGHLEEIWPDVGPNSQWLGGTGEGWERGPYYADGLVPLAFLLDDGPLKDKAHRWAEGFLKCQDVSGWIGPAKINDDLREFDAWPDMVVLKVLTQYHEATGDPRVLIAMERFCHWLLHRLPNYPLFSWGRMRWAELLVSIHWLYERTGLTWLLDLGKMAFDQGYDWNGHFNNFAFTEKVPNDKAVMESHVVNNAMGIKQPGVWYRQSRDEADREAVYQAIRMLDTYHGQMSGIFTGDEHFSGREPFQGTELCAVVEYLFSLEQAISVLGDPVLADRLERIAYNALPAPFKPDMWAHQYDQQANQAVCNVAQRPWTNGPDANLFGLEPHYGCCLANMHQGWPKLAAHLWMKSPDDGLAAIAYAPCQVTTALKSGVVQVTVDTNYPFDEKIRIRVNTSAPQRFPMHLRIPAWAEGAKLSLRGVDLSGTKAGSFYRIDREWADGDTVEMEFPMQVRAERGLHDSVTLVRGPLVYSLGIGEDWRLIRRQPPAGDWEVHPTTPWNYGLAVDPENPGAAVTVEKRDVGECPFSPEGAPVLLKARGKRVPGWQIQNHSAGPVPEGLVDSPEPVEEITLIPYGAANLRITEFPRVRP